jgi:hypothetical protein
MCGQNAETRRGCRDRRRVNQTAVKDTLPPTARQLKPHVKAACLLHRFPDAYAVFYRKKPDGTVETVANIRTDALGDVMPEMSGDLFGPDTYMTVNGFFAPRSRQEKHGAVIPGWMRRTESDLRALNAVYVDLDVGRLPLLEAQGNPDQWQTDRDVDCRVMKLADAGVIPQPSMTALSGRGVYVFWFLRDEENADLPPAGFKRNVITYKAINRALQTKLGDCAPDAAAVDAARGLRVPWSIHSATGNRVVYRPQLDEGGEVFTYTLSDLAERLGIEQAKPSGGIHVVHNPKGERSAAGRKGRLALNRQRKRDIEVIAKRVGIHQGKRRRVITHYAECHKVLGIEAWKAEDACKALAKKCRPKYPNDIGETPVAEIVAAVYRTPASVMLKQARLKTKTLVRWLRVTPEMARDLDLKTIVPKEVREARKRPGTRNREARREFVAQWRRDNPAASLRDTAAAANEAGFPCSPATVMRDIEADGLS